MRTSRDELRAAVFSMMVLLLATLGIHCGGTGASPVAQSTAAAPGGSSISFRTLDCAPQSQEHSQWCWAASSATILTYLRSSQDQGAIVDYVRGIDYADGNPAFSWADPKANSPIEHLYGPAPSVSDLMAHFGKPCTGRGSALAFEDIKSEVDAGRPFFINWAWPSGGGHILVGTGWDTRNGEQEVSLIDPWPNVGFKVVSYDWARSGSDPLEGAYTHTWGWTHTVNP